MVIVPYILRDFINDLDLSLPVLDISNDGTNTTITLSNIYHARKGIIYDIDGTDYMVISINRANNTVIVGGVIPSAVTATIQTPFFDHDTPYGENNKLGQIPNAADKLPLIYLLEILRETRFNTPDAIVDTEADIRLFFLDQANVSDWMVQDYYTNVIEGQRNLLEYFIDQLKLSGLIGEYTQDTIYNWKRFGVYQTSAGSTNSLFDEELSGVEWRVSLPILKNLNCG